MAPCLKAEQARVDLRIPLERANRILGQREVLQLDAATRERFYATIQAPATPSKQLRQLMNKDDDSSFKLVE